MNQFQSNIQYQRQVIRDRHQQIRRKFGASRTFRARVGRRDGSRHGPSR